MSNLGWRIAVIIIAVPAVVAGQAPRTARVPGEYPGHFVIAPPVSRDSVGRRCLELGDDTFNSDVRAVGECRASGVTDLAAAAGRRWSSALYERRWSLPATAGTAADTVAENEIVLFSAAEPPTTPGQRASLTPAWHYRFEPEALRSVTAEVVPATGGGALVGVMECVNGTGGCSQAFFSYRGARWRAVRAEFLDSLNRRYPGAVRHGFRVEMRTLHADAALYSNGDANCCPSRNAEMVLRLRGDVLEMVSMTVRALTPEQELQYSP